MFLSISKKQFITIKIISLLFFQQSLFGLSMDSSKLMVQNPQILQGKIIDDVTGDIIPYCSISILNSNQGTASNELGEFEIKVNSFPVELSFSHINYHDQKITISQVSSNLIVKLTPFVNTLDVVVLEEETVKNDKNASRLAKNLYKKISSKLNNEIKFGKAFYRQKTKTDNKYTEFSEILFDIKYDNGGVLKWDILEGRYALNDEGINNKNYTKFSQILKSFQPDTEDLIFPFHPELEKYYNVNIKSAYKSNNGDIVILKFTPKKNIFTPIFKGEAHINKSTLELLKIQGSVSNNQLKLVDFTLNKASKKNYRLSYEMAFKEGYSKNIILDYIKVDQEFDYYKEDVFYGYISSSSNLTFIEHYKTKEKKRLGKQFRSSNSDWDNLNEIGYNKDYWENNPIVKRTPVEKEVIDAFEKDNAFESIFLNSKDQITLLQSRISKDNLIVGLDSLLNSHNSNNPIEKVFLKTDKNSIYAEDNLWYSAFTVLGPLHQYSLASKVLYVTLINDKNEVIISQRKKLFDGTSMGHIKIPKETPSGNYKLIAYTDWMKNNNSNYFFKKTIKIHNKPIPKGQSLNKNNKLSIQFLPEGGHAVAGISNRIAFKLDAINNPKNSIEGKIIDSKGEFVTQFKSNNNGVGTFNLIPKYNEKYKAIIDGHGEFKLPSIINQGYNLFVNNYNPGTIKIRIQASGAYRNEPFYLIGSIRNYKFFQGRYSLKGNPFIDIEIPKNIFMSGVATLTLLDSKMKPWCERAVFIDNKNDLSIDTNIELNNEKDGVTNVNVTVKNPNGEPISANLSIAVTDLGYGKKDKGDSNILSYLLLESEIKNEIKAPGSYFNVKDRKTIYDLDMVMLTNGWRKFIWQNNMPDNNLNYKSTKGYNVSGTAHDKNGSPLSNAFLDMIVKSNYEIKMYNTQIGTNGDFTFENLNHTGDLELTFNGYDKNKKPIDVKISLNKQKPLIPKHINFLEYPSNKTNTESYNNIVEKNDLPNFNNNDITELDEVVLEGKLNKEKTTQSFLNVEPSQVLQVKESDVDITQVLSRGSGIFITGSVNAPKVRINGVGDVIWVIDGVTLPPNKTARKIKGIVSPTLNAYIQPNPAPQQIAALDVNNIERIEVLKGSKVSILGARGNSAAILIYTKKGERNNSKKFDSPSLFIEGFSAEREFYTPKSKSIPNKYFKQTLYWNGSVVTDENGKASISFPGANNKNVQISIDALSFNGIPGTHIKTINSTQKK